MKKGFFLGVILGSVVGSLVTAYLIKKRDEQNRYCENEDYFGENRNDISDEDVDNILPVPEEGMGSYAEKIKSGQYDYSAITRKDTPKLPRKPEFEYIQAEEVGDMVDEGYTTLCYTFYADGTTANELDEVVLHPEEELGDEWLEYMDRYEEDYCYVRNNRLKIDYCIAHETDIEYDESL